ncbi:MAG: hypothetical protein Q9227_003700 [Pyrenula ochraceoflavens]
MADGSSDAKTLDSNTDELKQLGNGETTELNGDVQEHVLRTGHEHHHNHEEDPTGGALFQINVRLPHEPYKIPVMVSSQEQVQDVRQSIVETPGTFQYTCFHLEHEGEKINDFIELSEVKGLQTGSELALFEDPYTEKEARMHVLRVRELIGAAGDRSDFLQGICAGMSLHDMVISQEDGSPTLQVNGKPVKVNALAGYNLKGAPSLQNVLPATEEIHPKTVKSLTVSPWNPPPYHLRQKGHLLYLQVTTNEGEQHQITSTVSGFFVNRSSNNKFDPFPRAAPKNHNAHSLLALLTLISPSFNDSFSALQAINNKKDLLTTFPFQNSLPSNPWVIPPLSNPLNQHQPDPTRAQEAYLFGGADGAESLRDWNEEFQTTRESPRATVPERVFRERLISKLFADYNDAAARGAALVARGEVPPLNPTEAHDAQIFVHNNIFFSFGADGVQTFASEGGDEAARVAVGKDVMGVKAVNQLDIPGLFTPGTIVVDYLGKRIVGQSIVPGIFKQREPGEHQIDYGAVDGIEVVAENKAFAPEFEKLSRELRVKRHAVWDKDGRRFDLEGSVQTKGLLGTDGRKYVLDLYRIAPLDIAWSEEVNSSMEQENNKYPHRMAILRLELVEAYRRSKIQQYVREEIEKRRAARKDDVANKENTKPVTNGEVSPEKLKEAEREESDIDQERVDLSSFEFALNPDVCSGQNPPTEQDKEAYAQDEKEVRAVCGYLRSKIIPELLQDLFDSEVGFPMDGRSLTLLLHKRGINVRYLGRIATLAAEKGRRLQALVALARQEMIARAFKHIANRNLRRLPPVFATACISHLLNCLLGDNVNPRPRAQIDEELRELYTADVSFERLDPVSLKSQVESEVQQRYRYRLPNDWVSSLKHFQMLRDLCLKLGLQLGARDFSFTKADMSTHEDHSPVQNGTLQANGKGHEDSKKKKKKNIDGHQRDNSPLNNAPILIFSPDDIINIVPIVKDAAPRSTLAEEALEAGRISLARNEKQLGQELVLESLSLHEQIYGILHPEVAKMYHQLSMLYYQTDEKDAAVELARKAVIVTERTLGVDSHDAILAYLNLSLFEHATNNTHAALVYVKHAMDVWNIIYGMDHPDSITTLNNAAVMLQNLKLYADSRKWFEASLSLCEDLFGRQSVHTATILFQLAQALALDHDSKAAVHRMREAYNIFLSELGANDRNTKEAESWLEQLTQNAVSIAKHAKDIQNRRFRRVQLTPRVTLGTRPQPQVGQTAAESGTRPETVRSIGLDSRSVDELLKFIEGGEASVSPSKKKRMPTRNPKLRHTRKTSTQ